MKHQKVCFMSKFKTTVIFLISAESSDTRIFSELLMQDLLQTKSNTEVAIIVIQDTVDPRLDDNNNLKLCWQIEYDEQQQKKIKTPVPQINFRNLGSSEDLTDVLNKIKSNFEAERYILFNWGHGFGFGIFNNKDKENNKLRANINVENNIRAVDLANESPANFIKIISSKKPQQSNFLQLAQFNSNTLLNDGIDINQINIQEINPDETDMLTMEELNVAIEQSITKVGVLLMLNCWMQSLETAYSLRSTVEYLVAPETVFNWNGYDYVKIIDVIIDDPYISNEKIAEIAVDSVPDKYRNLQRPESLSEVVLSAVCVEGCVERVAGFVNELSQSIMSYDIEGIADLKKTRRNVLHELSHEYIEEGKLPIYFTDLFTALKNVVTHEGILKNLKDEIEKKYVGKRILIGDKFNKDGNKTAYGFSVYFPNDDFYIDKSQYYKKFYLNNSPKQISFAKNNNWGGFIQAFNTY